jgi:N-acetylneuraminate lyase
MIKSFAAGDLETARQCSRRTVELIAVLLKFGGLRTGKAIMSLLGIDCGPPRPPVPPLTAAELGEVRRAYKQLGFFDDANLPAE